MKKIWRSCTALLMALCLMLGVCSTGLAAGLADYGVTEEDIIEMIKDGTIKIEGVDKELVEKLIEDEVIELPNDLSAEDLVDMIEEGKVEEIIEKVQQGEIVVNDPEAVMDVVQNGEVKVEVAPDKMVESMLTSGKLEAYADKAINYARNLAVKIQAVLDEKLAPKAARLQEELVELYADLSAQLNLLNDELAPHVAHQQEILANLVTERDALVAELASLNARLEALKSGSVARSATTASAKDQMIAELEADIAATEAQIAELEATIAWVSEQLKTDKSGIEAIKAAIADIKANIVATEAALAEINAAIDQLVADIAALNEALEVLVDASEALAGKTVGEVDVDAVVDAVITVVEKVPAIVENIQNTYELVLEVAADVEAAIAEIKASAAVIEENVKNLVASAEEFGAVVGVEAAIIEKHAKEMFAIVEAFAAENLPKVEAGLKALYAELKPMAEKELAKIQAKALSIWENNKGTVYSALAMGYAYCVQEGYVAKAKELIFKYTEITQDDIDAVQADLSYAEVVLKEQLGLAIDWLKAEKPVWEARLETLKAELKENVDPQVKAAIQAEIDKVNAKLAEIDAKIAEANELIDDVCNYFAEVDAAIEAVENALADVITAAGNVATDAKAICQAVKNLKVAICNLNDAVVDLHDAVVNEVNKLLGYCGLVADEAIDVVETLDDYVALLRYIPAIIEEAYIDATTDNYLVSIDSHYVALGDKNAYGAAADKLADELTAFLGAQIGYDNLTVEGQSALELLNALPGYAAAIEKADLVTVGFSANTFTMFVVEQLKEVLAGGTAAELDWEAHLGEEGAAYVANAMAALKAELVAAGAGEFEGLNVADIVVLAIESYAYSYMEFVAHYAQAVEGIHAINPNAQVVLVGMHNPMAGVVLDVEGTEIALGDYLEYLVDVSNIYSLGYAFIASETIFVDAPAVETINVPGVQNALFFVAELMMADGIENYVPTDAGYTYIQEQIFNALNVHKDGVLGDVNHDGKINSKDAVLVLRYATKQIGADALDLDVADVNGDGLYNSKDAVLILRYATGQITVFPAN